MPVVLVLAAWVVMPVTQAESMVGGEVMRAPKDVDLSLAIAPVVLVPGGTGVQTLRVRNGGVTDFAGPVAVTYVTAPYVNVDHDKALPDGCKMHLTDPDPTIPEVVSCRITKALAVGEELSVGIPVFATTRARLVGRVRGTAIAAPAVESGHSDVNLSDNWNAVPVTISRPTPKPPDGNPVDLYLTVSSPLMADDQPDAVTVTYGNKGPQDMLGDSQITYVTPVYVNVDHSKPLPRGCQMRLVDPDPLVPEIVVCTLEPLKAKDIASVTIPLVLVPDAPLGAISGTCLLAPPTVDPVVDVERSQIDNVITSTIVNINPSPPDGE